MALIVNAEDLKLVAKNLYDESTELKNLYNNQVKNAIESSKDAIVVSGLNFDDFNLCFNQAFNNLSSELENFSNALTNQILPKYDNLSTGIRNAFNNEFASQMLILLNKIK